MKSIEQQLAEQAGRDLPKPVRPVFVLDNGLRVPFDMRFVGIGKFGATYTPIIEGDLVKLMPRIVSLDADDWPPDCAIKFGNTQDGMNREWAERLLANSPILKRTMCNRTVIEKSGAAYVPINAENEKD